MRSQDRVLHYSASRGKNTTTTPYLCGELVGGFPSLDDLLDVAVDGATVSLRAFDEVNRCDYRLAGGHSTMNLLHSSLVTQRSTVRVVPGKIHQEVRVIPLLHAAIMVEGVKQKNPKKEIQTVHTVYDIGY